MENGVFAVDAGVFKKKFVSFQVCFYVGFNSIVSFNVWS